MLTAVYNYPTGESSSSSNLTLGEKYVVESVHMGHFLTTVYLVGVCDGFNSIMFDFFEDGEPIDIYSSPKYNPYLHVHS